MEWVIIWQIEISIVQNVKLFEVLGMRRSENYISNFLAVAVLVGWFFLFYKYLSAEYRMLGAGASFATHLVVTFIMGMIAFVYTLVCGLLMKLNYFVHRKLR